ncbi:ATP-dependent sacrificial sulfur transferase LarE [Actinomyces sp. F1_1611]
MSSLVYPAADLRVDLPAELEQIAESVAVQVGEVVDRAPGSRLGISYSGGVDSTVLAALTARALGRARTVLLLGISPSLARRERAFAHRQAEQLGLEVIEVETEEIEDPNYVANGIDRCYFCKSELFTRFDHLDLPGIAAVAYGENADDSRRPDRPGQRAAGEHQVLRPLVGATKAQIRAIADAMGLISADKPATPCLSSRIPHGQEVTAEKLAAIDAAEEAVFAAGFTDCRVRHHGTIARIEVPVAEFGLLADPELRARLLEGVKAAGFGYATLDLGGIQSGSFTLSLMKRPA